MKYFLMTIFLIGLYSQTYALRLSQFNYSFASVLPFYTKKNKKYIMLHNTRGPHWSSFEDFSTGRYSYEKHPVMTAARAIWKEELLGNTINLSLKQMQDYIDISEPNTQVIIANTTKDGIKHVTYITDFTRYWKKFIKNFYNFVDPLDTLLVRELALVTWDDLKKAFLNQKQDEAVYVIATVNPTTKKVKHEKILLSTYFMMDLRSFFCDESYMSGKNEKIRFYDKSKHEENGKSKEKDNLKKMHVEAKEFTEKERDPKQLALQLHALYESVGSDFPSYIFVSGTSVGYIHARQYIKAMEIEQQELKDEISTLSFFNFSGKRILRKKLKDGKAMLTILYRYKGTPYY